MEQFLNVVYYLLYVLLGLALIAAIVLTLFGTKLEIWWNNKKAKNTNLQKLEDTVKPIIEDVKDELMEKIKVTLEELMASELGLKITSSMKKADIAQVILTKVNEENEEEVE